MNFAMRLHLSRASSTTFCGEKMMFDWQAMAVFESAADTLHRYNVLVLWSGKQLGLYRVADLWTVPAYEHVPFIEMVAAVDED